MRLTETSLVRVQVMLLLAILGLVAKGSWELSALNTKVDTMWGERHPGFSIDDQNTSPLAAK